MDKITEFLAVAIGAITTMGGFLVKKLWSRVDSLEGQVDEQDRYIERKLLTKEDLMPIRDTLNLILQHLLEHRTTEDKDVHK